MKDDRIPFVVHKDDIGNPHQLRDATESVAWILIERGYSRSVMMFIDAATHALGQYRTDDRRIKKARRLAAARKALIQAAREFDAARRELKADG